MGLGGLSDVSLAAAREAAERWRAVAASGRDPIKERAKEVGYTLSRRYFQKPKDS
jgi:hypothetical protein